MAAVLVFVLLGIATAFAFVVGLGLFAVVPLLLAIVVGGWAAFALLRGATPGGMVRHTTRKPELLGPGGPDDPDRNR
jgi:hypothetical protein